MSAHTPSWDAAALERFLCRCTGAAAVTVVQAHRLSGGAIQENWWLQLQPANGELLDVVLRCDSASRVAESRSRAEEFALLQVAFDAGVTVPEPLWLGDDSLGRDFFIMRKADGVGAGFRLVKDLTLARDREALAEQIGCEMARLHRVRPGQGRLAFLPAPELGGAVLTGAGMTGYGAHADTPSAVGLRQCRDFLAQHPQPQPALMWALRWLEQHQPVWQDWTLTHRDWRTGNYLVNEHGLTAVLDWEFAAWSDPMEDLGWFCARCWRFGQDHLEAGGIGSRAALYRGYEDTSGLRIDPATVYFWEVYAHLRWAIIALQQASRRHADREHALELGLTAHIVPKLALELLRMTGGCPPELARTRPKTPNTHQDKQYAY
ncbi:MAG: phosphotransferase family protein [Pseudomonadota bacterium]